MLEVIDKGRDTASHTTPLLFLHGALHGAWCWDEHFLDYFAAAGYRALALNFRGHGASPTPTPIGKVSLADFTADLATTVDRLPVEPVLIAHSLGGFVAQKYLEHHDVPGCVLLASAPPSGGRDLALRALRRHPILNIRSALTGRLLPVYGTPELAREWFFSPDMPAELVERYAGMLQEDSARAAMDTLRHPPRPDLIRTPILVLGAGNDNHLPARAVRATARAYGVRAEFLPGLAHDIMLEAGWRTGANRIVEWLHERGI